MFLAVVLFAVLLITLLVLAYVRFQDRPRSPTPPVTGALDAPDAPGASAGSSLDDPARSPEGFLWPSATVVHT